MNPLNRTVHQIIEHNVSQKDVESFLHSNGVKAFQLVKHVTGLKISKEHDYSCEIFKPYHGFDTYTLTGQKGFIRFTLEPLFQLI